MNRATARVRSNATRSTRSRSPFRSRRRFATRGISSLSWTCQQASWKGVTSASARASASTPYTSINKRQTAVPVPCSIMQGSAAVRRLFLRGVQVLRDEVLDAFNMSGAGRPVQRRTSVRVDRCLYAVRVRFFEEGQVAGLRGVEHVGVVWCCLFTDHLRLHFCVLCCERLLCC